MAELFTKGEVRKCFQFAKDMIGNHNPNMIMDREDWEIFRDDFRGKLGEVAIRKYISQHMPNASIEEEIDYSIMPRGEWDKNDLVVNGLHVSVKSIKGKSRFLLIETYRYNSDGTCSYDNDNGEPVMIDLYALVRVSIEPEISADDMRFPSIDALKNEKNTKINYTILGGITHDEFWRIKHFAPRGILCSKENLEKVCRNMPPVAGELSAEKTTVLQQDNYVIDSSNELVPLSQIIL